jgi:hypothetical protein
MSVEPCVSGHARMLAIGGCTIRLWTIGKTVGDVERVDFRRIHCLAKKGSVACGDGRCTGVFVTASCGS